MAALLEPASPESELLRRVPDAVKIAVWIIATVSVTALFVMSRSSFANEVERNIEPGSREPSMHGERHSRLFQLGGTEMLAITTAKDSHELRLRWMSGSLEEPAVDEWTQQLAGNPRSIAMVADPVPALFMLVDSDDGRTNLVRLELNPASRSARTSNLLTLPNPLMGSIVDFEVTRSGDSVILLYGSQKELGKYRLISVDTTVLLGFETQSDKARVDACPARPLAADLSILDLDSVDIELEEFGQQWSIRLTSSGPKIEVDLESEKFQPSSLSRIVSAN